MNGYIPIEYPKWVGGVLCQNAAEEMAARPVEDIVSSKIINGRSPPKPPPVLASEECGNPPSAATVRMRRSRERRREGKRTVSVDISTSQIEALVLAEFIDPAKRDDAAEVGRGVVRLLDRLTQT